MRVLLVEDEIAVRFGVARHLERNGFVVAQAGTCDEARRLFDEFDAEAVVTDFRLPDGECLGLIGDFCKAKPDITVVVFTGFGSIELAVQALRAGASNLMTKPVDENKLVEELERARSMLRSRSQSSGTLRRASCFSAFVEKVKNVECSILIQGETGTGKTVLARAIHDASHRSARPFIDLNCAGLPRELVESELFGHERGAFTSAHAAKPGLFELAEGGTLFLDEIGDIDLAVQPKLLKAIDEKRFRRMGGVREKQANVRVIAATHRDLREAAKTNAFRSDLYYRISTVTFTLPPLRQRAEEIPSLAREILATLSAKNGRPTPELTADAIASLSACPWSGNIRELKNVLEAALHFSTSGVMSAADLDLPERDHDGEVERTKTNVLSSKLQDVEKEHLERALSTHGHVAEAARSLGISRSSMYLKLKAHGIIPSRGSTPRMKAVSGNRS